MINVGMSRKSTTISAMKRSEVLFGLLRLPLDILGVVAALLLSYILRTQNIDLVPWTQLLEPAQTLPSQVEYFDTFVVPGIGIFIVVAMLMGLYALRSTRSAWNEIGRVCFAAFLWLIVVIAWYFLLKKELFYSRILLLHSTVFIALFVVAARTCVVLMQRMCLRWGLGTRSILSIGKQAVPKSVQHVLDSDVRYAYLGHVKTFKQLQESDLKHAVDLVLQTDASPNSDDTLELINHCRSQHIDYAFLPPVFADVPHLLVVEKIGLTPLMRFQPTPLDGWGRVGKRLFDVVCSCLLIMLLSPLLLLVAIAVFVEGGLPIFYLSRRIGQKGQGTIPVIKFRSMVKDADAQKGKFTSRNLRKDGPLFKLKNDPRVTSLGRFLRRWDLDELPQLFNVLLGHMSLVGPRPHLPEEVKKYTQAQRRVFAVKPGITGLAQISGRSDLKFEDEVVLDLRYIEDWSPLLDLWILWRTIFAVLQRKDS